LTARGSDTTNVQTRALVALVTLLTAGRSGAATIAVSVDPNADRHAVSPQIFGMNFGDAPQMSRLKVPVRRWGGNSVTRYNWETDTNNSASDWFFTNYAGSANPANLPNGSAADVFVDEIRAAGGEALITVPLIGWTPIDRTRRWGFSVVKYGAQQQTECSATGYASWCNPDAGNGVKSNGSYVTANDPADTSKAIDATFVTRWMSHIAGRVGTAAAGGVRLWALDNEPMLWNSTHRDVHPAGITYDELWSKTAAVGAAIKAQDAGAKVLGPTVWGWCAYFFSGADGCSPGADRAAHGGEDFLPWYLDQAKAWETAHGTRLLDTLDVHYYPQASGVALTNDESTATSALRLRTLKSLYDPSYLDESWIGTDVGQAVYLIPRMKAWIAAHYPGTKLAISEYNWGSDDGISGALAQAEALAIFGREGVDLATRWVAPADNSKTEDAFLLYRNYDGAGAQVTGDSVRATSANVDAVGAYAIRGGVSGNTLYILLFNKDTAVQTAAVSVAGGLPGTTSLWRFAAASRLAAAGSAAPSGGTLTLDLPARSATLAVAVLAATPPPPPSGTSFHTVEPCRTLDTRNVNGPLGGPSLAAGVRRDFVLTGTCDIPSTAVSVSANVTVTGASAAGSLVAFPAELDQAPLANTLSLRAGATRANNAVLLLARDGSGRVAFSNDMSSGSAHLIVDVNGWWE
jgi:Glycoside hydrolase family 44